MAAYSVGFIPKHVCNICDSRETARWFCEECGQILCESCKKGHLNSRVSQHHHLSPLNKLQTINVYNRKADVCEDHDRKKREIFCKTCDLLICSICLAEKHKSHHFDHVERLQKGKQEQLINAKIDTEKHLQQLDQNERDMKNVYEQKLKDISFTEKEVKHYTTQLREKLHVLEKGLLDELSNIREQNTYHFTKQQERSDAKRKRLTKRLNNIKTQMENVDENVDINSLQNEANEVEDDSTVMIIPTFLMGRLRQMLTPANFGSLRHQRSNQTSELLRTDATFLLKESPVRSICPLNKEEKAWIVHNEDRVLTLVNIQGQPLMKRDAGGEIEDCTVDCRNNLFVCFSDNSTLSTLIKKINANGKEAKFAKFRLDVVGLCSDGTDIFASLKYEYHASVTRLSSTGNVIQNFKAYPDNTQLYYEPGRLSCLPGGTLVTIDQEVDNAKVIAIDKEGCYLFTWKGGYLNEGDLKFWPFDISHDNNGRILITDGDNHVIYILQNNGEESQCIRNQEGVTAIAGTDKNIWVGDMNGVIRITEFSASS